MKPCGRCGADVTDYVWWCWLCEAVLCSACGDRVGHCHHDDPALDEIDREWANADADSSRTVLLESADDASWPRGTNRGCLCWFAGLRLGPRTRENWGADLTGCL